MTLAERFWSELGDELVPLWDFRVTPDGPQKRDSSAGAIAACGMFKLATLVNNPGLAATFKDRAERITIRLTEAFACGTAAVVTPIGSVKGVDGEFTIGGQSTGPLTMRLRSALVDIQRGDSPDPYGWVEQVV